MVAGGNHCKLSSSWEARGACQALLQPEQEAAGREGVGEREVVVRGEAGAVGSLKGSSSGAGSGLGSSSGMRTGRSHGEWWGKQQ